MGDTGDGRNMTAREVYAEGERRATRDRVTALCTEAKLRAVELLDASRDASDAAVCNLACTLLAQYAAALEQAGQTPVAPPWFSRRQVAGDPEAAPSRHSSSGSGLPSLDDLRRELRTLAGLWPNDVTLGLVCSIADDHLAHGELHGAYTTLAQADDQRFAGIEHALRRRIVDAAAGRVVS